MKEKSKGTGAKSGISEGRKNQREEPEGRKTTKESEWVVKEDEASLEVNL